MVLAIVLQYQRSLGTINYINIKTPPSFGSYQRTEGLMIFDFDNRTAELSLIVTF
jgi:hypothetical protein